jgi:hypothetical protein
LIDDYCCFDRVHWRAFGDAVDLVTLAAFIALIYNIISACMVYITQTSDACACNVMQSCGFTHLGATGLS